MVPTKHFAPFLFSLVGIYNPHSTSLQRFEKLCRCILSSMDAENEPKVCEMGAEVSHMRQTHLLGSESSC